MKNALRLVTILLLFFSFFSITASLYAASEWLPADSMNSNRQFHTLNLLNSGKVLAVGHDTGSRSTETYNSTTNLWSSSGSTNIGRRSHTSHHLEINGIESVIIIGGITSISTISNSVEIYSVNSNSWTMLPNMNIPRALHASILLDNGNILIIGGETTGFAASNKVEEYNPTTNTWTLRTNMNMPRIVPTATVLQNGKVLVAGGASNKTTEIYDPVNNTWTMGPNMSTERGNYTATLLSSGKVLMSGGAGSSTSTTTSEVFDPQTNTFSPPVNMNFEHFDHTATLLSDGKVLIAGSCSSSTLNNRVELYDPNTNSWTETSKMNTGRCRHAAVLLDNGSVLISGGRSGPNVIRDAEIYTPAPPPGPTPFLRLPWKYEDKNLSFTSAAMAINSYFDHTYPLLSRGTVLSEPEDFNSQVTTFTGENSTSKDYSSHDGYDYGTAAKAGDGEPMVAAAAGVATLHSSKKGCGNAIYIDHDNGFQTRYCHMQTDGLIVQNGESVQVEKGQVIGKIGATGNVTGAHVHFMVVQDKNSDGNFEDNIPDGLIDPFGWQGATQDPWESYIFDYLGIARTGNKSHYLWDTSLDGRKESIPTTGKTVSNEKYKFTFDSNSFATNFNFSITPLPIADPSDNLLSAGYIIDAKATDSLGNLISQFLKPFTIEISFSDLDLANINPATLSIYSSTDNGKTWIKELTTIDTENKKASATINHLTQFALMGEKLDRIAPTTEASLSGQLGTQTFYRSDVNVDLQSTDNADGLGVDYILYNENDTEWKTYERSLSFSEEGEHSIEFYAVDKADNTEEIKSVAFTIDKTIPEMELSYDLDAQGLQVKGIDDQPDPTFTKQKITLLKNNYIVTDKAGNKVTLKTSGAEIGKQVLLSLDSLQYNTATPTALTKHALAITYAEKNNQITHFNQYFQVQNDKKTDLLYIPKANQTKIVSINGKGNKVTEVKDGIYLLNLKTNKGKFEYTAEPKL